MRIAFYAPMKSPDHPTPSGDREIARLWLAAFARAGWQAETVSTLRSLDREGSGEAQTEITARAGAEAERLLEDLSRAPPDLWFTYHCYYKAPDLIGPVVAAALNLPYVVAEPSVSPKRRLGPWSRFAFTSEAALEHADLLLWTTERDRPALEAAGYGDRMRHFPAFLELGAAPPGRDAQRPARLITVAMARPGDKLESYRRLAAALPHLDAEWELTIIGGGGDCGAEAEMQALFAGHLARVSFLGTLNDPAVIRAQLEASDVFVWPGVNEGVGMVWLEAQAAGLPAIAEDSAAARSLLDPELLAPPGDAPALARTIARAIGQRRAFGEAARARIDARHGLAAATSRLKPMLEELVL